MKVNLLQVADGSMLAYGTRIYWTRRTAVDSDTGSTRYNLFERRVTDIDARSDEEISTMEIEDHLPYRKSEGKFN